MAKIIDFKTKQVLADLPYKRTEKRMLHWQTPFESNVTIIASEHMYAVQIAKQVEGALKVKVSKAS